jgi:hypothetical protein
MGDFFTVANIQGLLDSVQPFHVVLSRQQQHNPGTRYKTNIVSAVLIQYQEGRADFMT